MADALPPPPAPVGEPRRKRPRIELSVQLQCPCCFRPGNKFCDAWDPENAAKRLVGIRALMKAHEVDAYIVTSQDAHSSEYIADADERRCFLTGFSGSAGTALVTAKTALLWTDSRYFLQAEEQLKGTEWQLMKQHHPGVLELRDWVPANLASGSVVGLDPVLVASETGDEWCKKWSPKGIVQKRISENLVDAIWTSRPEDPCNLIQVHPLEYAGEAVEEKIQRVRAALEEHGADCIVLSTLDQIAWLFNLRGSDIACNPVFFSYAIVSKTTATLFVRALDEGRGGLSKDVDAHLRSAKVDVSAYSKFFDEAKTALSGKKVLLEPSTCSVAILSLVPADLRVEAVSPVENFKAAKNNKEIEGLRAASLRDSVAICEFLALVEARLSSPEGEPLTEASAADLISSLRKKHPMCIGDSFPTISSVGSNCAIIHYRPEAGKCKTLSKEEIYLCDTGGQYKDGTTDITRTVHFGTPTAEEKRCFTRVLQGHIALSQAVFPDGTPGLMLDMLARQHLWQDGLNYGHGTGHGMGAYLNVHEGPIGIGGGSVPGNTIQGSERMKRAYLNPFHAGHFVSNEPGCYKDGEFGIRIESDLVVVPAETLYQMGARSYLRFDYLTLAPICKSLLDLAIMTKEQIQWLDSFHAKAWDAMQGHISAGPAKDWLRKATLPVA